MIYVKGKAAAINIIFQMVDFCAKRFSNRSQSLSLTLHSKQEFEKTANKIFKDLNRVFLEMINTKEQSIISLLMTNQLLLLE